MKDSLFRRLGVVAILVLAILIFSQGLWLWQQLEQEKQSFALQLKQELTNVVSLHTLKLFGKNANDDSFTAEEVSEKEIARALPSKVYKIDTEKYPTDKSMLQRLEAAIADELLEREQIKLESLDSLFTCYFSGLEKIQTYRMQFLKNGEVIDSLYQEKAMNKVWVNSPATMQIFLPLGTKGIYVFAVDFQLETLPFLRQMVYSIAVSALAVILVAIFMLWLLWALQQQVMQLRWRERAVSGIVHDLKSPLSYVYTFLDYLANKELKAATQQEFANASTNISRLTGKMEVLLTLFGAKKKKIVMEPAPCNLEQKCKELLSELEFIYQEKKPECSFFIPENLHINVDTLYFDAALRNLLDNALKYSGIPAKMVITTRKEQKKLYIYISDFGKGIPRKEQKKIFGEFYRADSNSKGHGIGLAFTRQIVKAHKGHIKLRSEVGKGSTFCIILPVQIIV